MRHKRVLKYLSVIIQLKRPPSGARFQSRACIHYIRQFLFLVHLLGVCCHRLGSVNQGSWLDGVTSKRSHRGVLNFDWRRVPLLSKICFVTFIKKKKCFFSPFKRLIKSSGSQQDFVISNPKMHQSDAQECSFCSWTTTKASITNAFMMGHSGFQLF